jgi:hypothetical protein
MFPRPTFKKTQTNVFFFPFFLFDKSGKTWLLAHPPSPPNRVSKAYKILENSPQFIANHVSK